VQRLVLYLGEINSSQAAVAKAIEVLVDDARRHVLARLPSIEWFPVSHEWLVQPVAKRTPAVLHNPGTVESTLPSATGWRRNGETSRRDARETSNGIETPTGPTWRRGLPLGTGAVGAAPVRSAGSARKAPDAALSRETGPGIGGVRFDSRRDCRTPSHPLRNGYRVGSNCSSSQSSTR
jgi:hypothetical protein